MATTETKLRRGTASQCDLMTPAEGEVVIDLTNDRPRVGDGTRAGGFPVPNFNDIQGNRMAYAAATGTNTISATYSPSPTTPFGDGVEFTFKAAANNTGAVTFNPNGAGGSQVVKNGPGGLIDLVANDIIANGIYTVRRTGTIWHLIGSGGSASNAFIGFRAVSASIQAAGGAPVAVQFGTESFDEGGYFASSTYTPPEGYYRVTASITFQTASSNGVMRSLSVYVNNTPWGECFYNAPLSSSVNATSMSFDISELVYVDGNDPINIYFDATGPSLVGGRCFFMAEKVG